MSFLPAGADTVNGIAVERRLVRDPILLDQRYEIGGRVPRQRGFMEVRIRAEVILGLASPICKIAPPSAGDQNFSTDLGVMLEDGNAPPAFSGLSRAH